MRAPNPASRPPPPAPGGARVARAQRLVVKCARRPCQDDVHAQRVGGALDGRHGEMDARDKVCDFMVRNAADADTWLTYVAKCGKGVDERAAGVMSSFVRECTHARG